MGQQIVLAQEVQARRRVAVVLVAGRLLRLRLDVELTREPDGLLVIDRQVQEPRQVVELALHVRVPERGVALAPAPERVPPAAEGVRHLDGLLDLRRRVGEHVGVGARRRAVDVARVAEQRRRAPQQLDARAFLLLLEDGRDGVQVAVGFREGLAFRGHVAVVEGVERRAELLEELEGDAGALLRVLDRRGAVVPGPEHGAGAERVRARAAEGVPVGHREAQVVAHRLAVDDLIGVVVLERERVPGRRTFVGDGGNVRKGGSHVGVLRLGIVSRTAPRRVLRG